MSRIDKLTSNWRTALIGAGAAIVLGLLFLWTPLGTRLTNASYDLLFYFRSDITNIIADDVLLVVMDDESHRQLGPYWHPWDRSTHAALIERLKGCGAKTVVFDILFDTENPTNSAADVRLVQAARNHGGVAMAGKLMPQIHEGNVIGLKLTPPFYALRTNVAWGVVEGAGEDKSVRQHYPGYHDTPSLAERVAQITMHDPPPAFQPRWLNYYGPPGLVPRRSFWEVLLETNRVGLNELSNKVVFVGAQWDTGFSGGTGTDDFRTPYTRWTGRKAPGVEIIATAYLNLLRHDWLTRPSPGMEFALLVLIGMLLGGGLVRLKPISGAGLSFFLFLLLGTTAMVLFWRLQIWFPWLIVGVVQIPTALGWSVLAHTKRLHHENQILERELALASSMSATRSVAPVIISPQPASRYYPDLPQPALGAAAQSGTPVVPDHTLLRRVGEGSYGEVWLARDVIGTYHAVKVVHRRKFQNEPAPFDREFRGIQKFTPISRSHPGFVHILHVGRNDAEGYFYYVMEAGDDEASGQNISPDSYSPKNLAKMLLQHGALPPAQCLDLATGLAAALAHLHQHQLIHRDIKPSNIIFVGGQAKFADIGLVTDFGGTASDVSYVGTQGYIAPEGPGTPAADIYSLGKVIYQASTGQACARFPELPTALIERPNNAWLLQINRIFLKACEPDPRRRYQSALEMRADLESLKLSTSI